MMPAGNVRATATVWVSEQHGAATQSAGAFDTAAMFDTSAAAAVVRSDLVSDGVLASMKSW
jgi:hypothetical protein